MTYCFPSSFFGRTTKRLASLGISISAKSRLGLELESKSIVTIKKALLSDKSCVCSPDRIRVTKPGFTFSIKYSFKNFSWSGFT